MNEATLFRFAKSFFEIADEDEAIDKYQEELKFLEEIFKANPDYVSFLDSHLIDNSYKKTSLNAIFSSKLGKATFAFLNILVREKAISGFSQIVDNYIIFNEEKHNIFRGKILTPFSISEDKIKRIEALLSKKLGCQVILKVVIDTEVIGGIKVIVKDTIYDFSLESKLNQIKTSLLNKGVN